MRGCLNCFSHVQLFVTLWNVARYDPLSMGILQAIILAWIAMPSFQGLFLTQGLNLGLLHCRQMLYHLSHEGSHYIYLCLDYWTT